MASGRASRFGVVVSSVSLVAGLWVGVASAAPVAVAPAAVAVTAAAPVVDPVVVAAGDIACGRDDARFSGSNLAACQMRATADQVAAIGPQYLLPLGDTQYASGAPQQGVQPSAADYQGSYNTSWGALAQRVPGMVVRPVPGNHEYGNINGSGSGLASGSTYFDNFGPRG